MGVIIGKVFQKQKDPETPDFITPTPKQIQIIKDSWEVPKANITDTGEIILFRFLDDFPSNQKKFQAFANVPLLSLKGTPGFRTHADHIMNLFQRAIDCLDTDDVVGSLRTTFIVMATNHARRVTPKAAFFELRGVLVDVLTEACNLDEEQQQAWIVFYNCAMNIIFNSFDEYNETLTKK